MKIMIDGYFIRSLLLAFFFKMFPDIIIDGRIYIASPPLYRVDDKKNPFVINKEEYIDRYIKSVLKNYRFGYEDKKESVWLDKNTWREFLTTTSSYVDDMMLLSKHYNTNDRLIEIILEEFAMMKFDSELFVRKPKDVIPSMMNQLNIQHLMDRIGTEFSEIYYDDHDHLIKGVIDGTYQLIEVTSSMVRKCREEIVIIKQWIPSENHSFLLKDIKTGTEYRLSLLQNLKILKKYQPKILHRFKGLTKTRSYESNCREILRAKSTAV